MSSLFIFYNSVPFHQASQLWIDEDDQGKHATLLITTSGTKYHLSTSDTQSTPPVKRLHEIASFFPTMESLDDKMNQENTKCDLLCKTSDKALKLTNPYANIPKTPDDQQLVHRRRSKRGHEMKFPTQFQNPLEAPPSLELPFILPLDETPIKKENEKNGAGDDLSQKGSITTLKIDSNEVDSFLTCSTMDSVDYRVRHARDKPSMTVTGQAQTRYPSRVQVLVRTKSVLSSCSDLSDEEYDVALQEKPLPVVDILFKQRKASTATKTMHRCIRNVSSNVAMNPAA